MQEIDDEELFGSDIKIEQIKSGKIDFAINRNGDLIKVSGSEYIKQRVIHIILVRKRFIPPQIPQLINNNEILKNNVSEEGKHFFPGDLEELGYPKYGSLIDYMLQNPDSPQSRILMTQDLSNSISYEFDKGVDRIDNILITQPEPQIYNVELTIGLVNNETIEFSQNIGVEL